MFEIISSAFKHQGEIPSEFSCDGRNISPELSWNDAPADTKSFALIMHDPDVTHVRRLHSLADLQHSS
jgi:phosphatidylethanolamine-binding protein (PEBP) family uncharacterized protein